MAEARRFPNGCVASPHHLASSAGSAVLASGGNALDAAVAANLVLGVVMPYACGFGGDLFALVWDGDLHAYAGAGGAPAAATAEAVSATLGDDVMPPFSAHAVTVPGAVDGWFALIDRFGTRTFGELARPAAAYASGGFTLTSGAAVAVAASARGYAGRGAWHEVYGGARSGEVLRQPDLARTIDVLSDEGPDVYYRGPIASAIEEAIQAEGGFLTAVDLAEHRGAWVAPMRASYREVEVVELPPPTQGVTALEGLRIVEAVGALPPDGPDRHHLLIEAFATAMVDRSESVTDPAHMRTDPYELLADGWVRARAETIDPERTVARPPARPGRGGTVYLCAADADGMLVSLIQSNFIGFGSGITVPGWGISLHDRAAYVSLDPDHADVIAPGKRPLHTLIPAMAFRDGRPWLVFGTMGGDNQAAIHLQLLARIVDDGDDLQRALDAPRWAVSPHDWSVRLEERFEATTIDGLRSRGHEVVVAGPYEGSMGWAQAIGVDRHGYLGASDPRPEGAVTGW